MIKIIDLSRPIILHCCRDGTITYRTRKEPTFNGAALPVFSVDTIEQAQLLQVLFCRLQYGEHPLMKGKPWYRWTEFDGKVQSLELVTDRLRKAYNELTLKK